MRVLPVLLVAAVLALPLGAATGVEITVNESARRVDGTVDDKPFTSYIWRTTLQNLLLPSIRV